MKPNLREEKKLWKKGYRCVAGLDEAGRGPLAGPVVAAAVAAATNSKIKSQKAKLQFKIQNELTGVKDSKQLSAQGREELYGHIVRHPALMFGVGIVSEKIIDKINTKNAAELAMEKALKKLEKKIGARAGFLIIDGNQLKNPKLKSRNHNLIVGADEKVFSCAAASIIAKVTRDRIMMRLHKKYPQYGFDKHKGYPTKLHRKMLKKYGPSKIHRKSFAPVNLQDRFFCDIMPSEH